VNFEQQRENVFQVARQVARIVRQQIRDPRYRIVMFGSWAHGHARERSDIDMGILGPAPVDPRDMDAIRAACETLDTLYTIELVDLHGVGSEVGQTMVLASVEMEAA
jgi:predicted nucleotidyltransferase